jgi:hypothetical protein
MLKLFLIFFVGLILYLGFLGAVQVSAQLFSINLSIYMWIIISLAIFAIYLILVISELKWQLSRKRDLQERIDNLAKYRQEAITELYAVTPTADIFPAWVEHFNRWENSLVQYLKGNFPYAVFEMFQDLGMIPNDGFSHTSQDPKISASHLHHLRMLARHIKILERLIQENTNLLPEEKPSLGKVLKSFPGD